MIYRLVYASSAASGVSEADLENIARTSRLRNIEHGVTGMLLWYDGNIMQILEGEPDAVLSLYANIRSDERNSGCYVLHSGHFETREFPNWSMGYQVIPSDETEPCVFALSNKAYETLISKIKDNILNSLTKTFGVIAGI